ncbi:site-specific DNA-methyltransferase [Roseicella sp. DB1501]|uniref:DNA-methyltransferase n=1 Tax=Roseicella sp. DB1501 TaxID=2730925 RepID=UPI0014929493|nr:site-specific DNA-methyltransferase [Roseicella sp. DB1501]NOG74243.1 site-specific DNA-methyltransferase [Roseicella sp. DB1501]
MRQIAQDGQTVVFGSSKNMEAVPDGTVTLSITSPPYWNLKAYGDTPGAIGHSEYERYLADLDDVWAQCFRKAKDNGVLIVNINMRRHQKRLYPIPFDIASRMKGWVLWDVNTWYVPNALPQPNAYMERILDNKVEYMLVFTKNGSSDYYFSKPRVPQKYAVADPRAEKKNKAGRCLGNVIRVPAYRPPNVREMNYHIAAFPEELVAFYLQCYSREGDMVLDPFLGSGTTLKVARVMGRSGVGFEIEDKFEPVIRAKISEAWEVPDWRSIDLLHSTSMQTGMLAPRKVHFARQALAQGALSTGLFNHQEDG